MRQNPYSPRRRRKSTAAARFALKKREIVSKVNIIISQGEGRAITREVDFVPQTTKQYLVRVKTGNVEYEGMLFNPFPEERLSDVIGRVGGFLNLKDARDLSTEEKFPFMVVNKSFIETIKVIEER